MSGTYLLVDIDECSSSPCFNGATCWHETDIYHCNCSAGYDGTNCETGTVAFSSTIHNPSNLTNLFMSLLRQDTMYSFTNKQIVW